MKALITVPICPLMLRPESGSERADEVLLGMTVDILENVGDGWARVLTQYGYTGYARTEHLLLGDEHAHRWADRDKAFVIRGVCDVLERADIRSPVLLSLVRGCVVVVEGDGVVLPDGRTGYLRRGFLEPYHKTGPPLRAAIVGCALSYFGAPYRWGGKTPLGIDCSGLVSMAYLLNGVIIWRDASMKEGFPVRPIERKQLKPADLLFFPGHVAMYLGKGEYIHSTAKEGCDGVVINSLDPRSPRYREDLARSITAMGSIF